MEKRKPPTTAELKAIHNEQRERAARENLKRLLGKYASIDIAPK